MSCSFLPGGSGQPCDSSVGGEAQLAAAAVVVAVAVVAVAAVVGAVECTVVVVVVEENSVDVDISAAAGVYLTRWMRRWTKRRVREILVASLADSRMIC